MRTFRGVVSRSMEALFAVFSVLLAASYSQAAGVNQTGRPAISSWSAFPDCIYDIQLHDNTLVYVQVSPAVN